MSSSDELFRRAQEVIPGGVNSPVRAFRGVEVSVVSPFRYAAVVWATLLGFLIWGHVPNALAIAGTLVIVASGLYTMHREALRPLPSQQSRARSSRQAGRRRPSWRCSSWRRCRR